MPRSLQTFLLGCVAVAFAFLVIHAREPLRLNIGDPEADANVLTAIGYIAEYGLSGAAIADVGPLTEDSFRDLHAPIPAQLVYGSLGGYLGLDQLLVLRLITLAFSAVALLLLFLYARRMWTDTVAMIATMLFGTSYLWLTHADSLNGAPILQASAFLSLWGLVRAIETKQRRHVAAAVLGACVCFLSGFDYWLFLPAAAVFTVHTKRASQSLLWWFAAGCFLGVLIKVIVLGWDGFVMTLNLLSVERTAETVDKKLASPVATLVRRFTLVFTPLFWFTTGFTVWRAVRAPSLRAVLHDGVTWMLVVALGFLYVFSRFAASQMIGSQALLPFYALASALLIARLLEAHVARRMVALAWLALAPAWSFYFLLTHPRSVLERDDVARVNAYLSANDRNDFVMSNLLSDGHIQVTFHRHNWTALDTAKVNEAPLAILDMLELAGTDYAHAIVFTGPDSRFLDKSLWQLAMHRRLWAVTGWPHLLRAKTNGVIRGYDKLVLANLHAAGATKVVDLPELDVYRIDRAAILANIANKVPVVRQIDLSSVTAARHLLLGWSEPWISKDDGRGMASIDGYFPCPNPVPALVPGQPRSNACKTLHSRSGLSMMDQGREERAQLMIRVERSCDLRITIELGWSSLVELTMNDYTEPQCVPANKVTFVVPQRSVRAGINTISLQSRFTPEDERVDVSSIKIDPICSVP